MTPFWAYCLVFNNSLREAQTVAEQIERTPDSAIMASLFIFPPKQLNFVGMPSYI